VWRIRYNEINKLCDDVAVEHFLRLKRLQWAGHVVKMRILVLPRKYLEDVSVEESRWESLEENGRC
jgi:hypothetical protein